MLYYATRAPEALQNRTNETKKNPKTGKKRTLKRVKQNLETGQKRALLQTVRIEPKTGGKKTMPAEDEPGEVGVPSRVENGLFWACFWVVDGVRKSQKSVFLGFC